MIRFLRPVALCVVFVFGAVPGASAMCQWACASQPLQAHHPATHDHGAASHASPLTADSPVLSALDVSCSHQGQSTAPALASTDSKAPLPAVVDVSPVSAAARGWGKACRPDSGPHSPPGARSAPFSLRI